MFSSLHKPGYTLPPIGEAFARKPIHQGGGDGMIEVCGQISPANAVSDGERWPGRTIFYVNPLFRLTNPLPQRPTVDPRISAFVTYCVESRANHRFQKCIPPEVNSCITVCVLTQFSKNFRINNNVQTSIIP